MTHLEGKIRKLRRNIRHDERQIKEDKHRIKRYERIERDEAERKKHNRISA